MVDFHVELSYTTLCYWVYDSSGNTVKLTRQKRELIEDSDLHGRVEVHDSMLIVLTYDSDCGSEDIEHDRADLESILNG